ncbi:MAG: hypothetical protein MUF62_03470, partial [Chitinophagaceae bacterium]|nr:hypothetical protein [Chitinophagaceae bacterium]
MPAASQHLPKKGYAAGGTVLLATQAGKFAASQPDAVLVAVSIPLAFPALNHVATAGPRLLLAMVTPTKTLLTMKRRWMTAAASILSVAA